VKEYGRDVEVSDENVIGRMCIACSITKATNTHIISNTYCFSMAKMVTRTTLNITFMRTLPVFFVHNVPKIKMWKEYIYFILIVCKEG
jgi:hypothetical protein